MDKNGKTMLADALDILREAGEKLNEAYEAVQNCLAEGHGMDADTAETVSIIVDRLDTVSCNVDDITAAVKGIIG